MSNVITTATGNDATSNVRQLHERLTAIHKGGELSGADAVEVLDAWFRELGMPLPHPDSGDSEGSDEPADEGGHHDGSDEARACGDPLVILRWEELCRYDTYMRLSELNAVLAQDGEQPVTTEELDRLAGQVGIGDEIDLMLAARVNDDFEGAYERTITDTEILAADARTRW